MAAVDQQDPVLAALDSLVEALRRNIASDRQAIRRAAHICRERERGLSYGEIVTAEVPPLIVELTRQSLDRLAQHGAQLRRVEARALYDEGMTMKHIAALFGVTRQRVSVLLQTQADRDGETTRATTGKRQR